MGYRLIQTRRGSMLAPTLSAAQRRKARQQARSVRRAMAKRCKCWHGEAARLYHEELMRNKQSTTTNSFGVGDSIVPPGSQKNDCDSVVTCVGFGRNG
jgi:hypothetical protein